MAEVKKVVYEKIEREVPDPAGGPTMVLGPIYQLMETIKNNYHLPQLVDCNIVMLWHKGWKPDRDGISTLGQAIKIDDRTRQLCEWDVEIVLNYDFWNNPSVTDAQRAALIDHELAHIRPVPENHEDPDSLPKRDENGRIVYYLRKHNFEEFTEILERHGLPVLLQNIVASRTAGSDTEEAEEDE